MKNNSHKVFTLAIVILLMLMFLTACNDEDHYVGNDLNKQDALNAALAAQNPTDSSGASGEEGENNFTLQSPGNTNFDDIGLTHEDDPQQSEMYTIDGGYAYALDPDTLQPTGDPLDPITHEPADLTDVENLNPPKVDPDPKLSEGDDKAEGDTDTQVLADSISEGTSSEQVAPQVKLPNTGIFLEDD